ncbi:hypothetical protein AMTRI_Chr08g163890 [Amborella trichopoda]
MQSSQCGVEEEYIDMEVSSTHPIETTTTSTSTIEFDFHRPNSGSDHNNHSAPSPADELFYMGNLLPLHLPPRLHMLHSLLISSSSRQQQHQTTSADASSIVPPLSLSEGATPFESCDATPLDSCHVSGELKPECYFDVRYFDAKDTLYTSIALEREGEEEGVETKKKWSKKLKLINPYSSLGLKLKASRAYIKSLFTRLTGNEPSQPHCKQPPPPPPNSSSVKKKKKNPFGQIERESYYQSLSRKTTKEEKSSSLALADGLETHRRSFSGATKTHLSSATHRHAPPPPPPPCLSNSSSLMLGGEWVVLKRSSSTNSEVECSIQGAIAYCKQSQLMPSRKSDASSHCSLSMSRIAAACEHQERPGLCRG